MARSVLLVTTLFGLGAFSAPAQAERLVLVEDGVSRAPVIVYEGAPPRTRRAAEELIDYLEKISGARPELIEGRPDPIPEHAVWVGYQPVLDELFPDLDFTRLMMECVPLMDRVRESGGEDAEAVKRAAANWDRIEEIAEETAPHGFWFSVISSRMQGGYMGGMADHLGPPSDEFRERSEIDGRPDLDEQNDPDEQNDMVKDGQPNAEILIAENPPRSVRLAARELQTYVEKITGATLEIVTKPTGGGPVTVYVGESPYAERAGVTAEGLEHDSFRMVSGDNWLALVGDDEDFMPIEPWARSRSHWLNEKQQEWERLAEGHWNNPVGQSLEVDYREDLDLWRYDRRGSLNAVYEFLRGLGVRWYMPGELGEILPEIDTLELPEIDRTVEPEIDVRTMNFARFGRGVSTEDCLWYLRLGASREYGVMHHGMRYLTEHPEQREAHPEYYVLLPNGERDTESKTANACLSSEGFFKENVRFARLMFDHYDVSTLSVMPHDGFTQICQCVDCRAQATRDRGSRGWYSDYVWNYVVRVAEELGKTHPEKKILCGAYSTYQLPPTTIDKLPDNVFVQITNGRPRWETDDETHTRLALLRQQWQEKTNNKLSLTMNYPMTQRGEFRPQYFPHVIARGIRDVKDNVWREDIWVPEQRGLHYPGMNHLNAYVISRFWWDADRDVDALLDEYCRLFYGPAAEPMRAFIEYSEAHYADIGKDAEVTNRVLELFGRAKSAAATGSPYARRIALIDAFLETLRKRQGQLAKGRQDVPEFSWMIDLAKDKWRDSRETLVMDGKLDEPFWTEYFYGRPLVDLETGETPEHPTRFYARWWDDNVYLGIRCEVEAGGSPTVGTDEDGDPAIWNGDHVEVLIETDQHAYYQIVVNPAGAVTDLDRGASKSAWYDWSSDAEVATHVGDGHWSVEMRLPISASSDDPLHTVVGRKPTESLPWYFNIGRKRGGTEDGEVTVYSPGGDSFHDASKFGKLRVR